jgi:c-di-GMP-binding flagellar brake protein YcgR
MADQFELLREAIDRNTAITLSLPSAGMMRPHKSRLLELRDDAIWLESIAGQADALDAIIAAGDAVRVSFRSDRDNVEFSSTLLERIRGYKLNASTEIEALRVTQPATVKVVQRRSDYRVTIAPDADVSFKCWRIGEQYDFVHPLMPPAATAMALAARDLSAGGLGGLWKRRKDEPTSLVPNQRLRIDISSSAGAIILDSRVRFTAAVPDPDCSRIGIQFALSATSLPDRQKLTLLNKLIGELQRAELRRVKLAR